MCWYWICSIKTDIDHVLVLLLVYQNIPTMNYLIQFDCKCDQESDRVPIRIRVAVRIRVCEQQFHQHCCLLDEVYLYQDQGFLSAGDIDQHCWHMVVHMQTLLIFQLRTLLHLLFLLVLEDQKLNKEFKYPFNFAFSYICGYH